MNANNLVGASKIACRASVIVKKEKNNFRILKDRNPEEKKVLLLMDILLDYPNDATLVLIDN